jgi:hypothetical protein
MATRSLDGIDGFSCGTRVAIALVALVALVALALCTRPLAAQAMHGTVRDSASSQPISGAVFMLLDSSGVVLGRRITDERGLYRIPVPPAARWARLVRIGFRPRELRVPATSDWAAVFDLTMVPVPTMLAPVRVRDESHCPRRDDRAAALGLWEQVRAGLLATIVAREDNAASVRLLTFDRAFDGNSDRITRLEVNADSITGTMKSFDAARSAKDFVQTGFSVDSGDTRFLFGPDAVVLLDEAFATGYCFRLAEAVRTRPSQVGLAFSPATRPPGRVDIDGTLWVDTAARVLRDIEYRYDGLPGRTDAFHPGGRISFRQMANGSVMIDRWYIRSVAVEREMALDDGESRVSSLPFAHESGGELASAAFPDGRTWHDSLGTLRIHAVRGAGKPATDIEIALPGTHYRAATDANGDAEIRELIPGPYSVEIVEPRVAELGIRMPTPVKFIAVRDSVFRATVKVSSLEEWMGGSPVMSRKACDTVFVLGRVVTTQGRPVARAKVTFAALMKTGVWSVLDDYFTTGADGVFMSCGRKYEVGSAVKIRVQREGQFPVEVIQPLTWNVTVVSVRVPPAP